MAFVALLPLYGFCKIGGVWAGMGAPEEVKAKRNKLTEYAIIVNCFLYRVGFALCFWIQRDYEGDCLEKFRAELGATGKPFVLVANHSSFFDVFISVAMCPLHRVGKARQFVSESVFKMPIFGVICSTMQHAVVPFKGDANAVGKFEVDKEKLAEVMVEYENHLKGGGFCAWFPEGQVNRGDCSKLQQFRAGGCGIATRNDVEIWVVCFTGCAAVWPYGEPMGGYPGKVCTKIWCLTKSSKEWLKEHAAGKEAREEEIILADALQKQIQDALDKSVAVGYKAGDNTKKKKPEEAKKD